MMTSILSSCKKLGSRAKQHLKQWTKPVTAILVTSTLSDMTRSRADLIAENVMLRQQLIVLNRQVKRPQFTNADRIRLVLLARCTRFWQQALHIVQPDTLLRWHRDLFRRYWRRKSRNKKRKPRIARETSDLIRQMAKENRLWGAERIRGELLKLGIRVSKRTIQKYMPKVRRNSSQTWATFLLNHASEIWACDFFQTFDIFFHTVFVFVIIELGSRRVVHFGVTRSPTDQWTAQQLREATAYGEGPRFLIRDNDAKFGPSFARVARGTGIEVLKTPYRAPRANAICEWFLGSLRRECLDHLLILNERHLYRGVGEYKEYFNHARPHQGVEQRIPCQPEAPPVSGKLSSRPVLRGLHHDYYWQTIGSVGQRSSPLQGYLH
jgi:transposase InsO family protein